MVSKIVKITAPNGMHARPVSALTAYVKGSGCVVTFKTPVKSVNASSMIGVLSLGLKCGAEVEVSVDGVGEESVLDQIVTMIESIKE